MANTNTLYCGQVLGTDKSLTSNNGACFVCMQGDGNMCLYPSAKPDSAHCLWASGSWHKGFDCLVTPNGQLVVRSKFGEAVYTSPGHFPEDIYKLVVENDGDMVLYSSKDVPVWHTNTSDSLIKFLHQQK
ncbi:hypothetical protein SELMODRAFT_403316 [Selaginella moellendorffii]|uniref:Bulb-type lectin domain-containing protein n=1 Tax=Selaginella moellendorffii TaxID=88036 RepID=D8QTS5_SELML|nr:hypothetical protein SELMODRAFT_403316 [Selaginella moellendorffii]